MKNEILKEAKSIARKKGLYYQPKIQTIKIGKNEMKPFIKGSIECISFNNDIDFKKIADQINEYFIYSFKKGSEIAYYKLKNEPFEIKFSSFELIDAGGCQSEMPLSILVEYEDLRDIAEAISQSITIMFLKQKGNYCNPTIIFKEVIEFALQLGIGLTESVEFSKL